jgi:hypothetical protein
MSCLLTGIIENVSRGLGSVSRKRGLLSCGRSNESDSKCLLNHRRNVHLGRAPTYCRPVHSRRVRAERKHSARARYRLSTAPSNNRPGCGSRLRPATTLEARIGSNGIQQSVEQERRTIRLSLALGGAPRHPETTAARTRRLNLSRVDVRLSEQLGVAGSRLRL